MDSNIILKAVSEYCRILDQLKQNISSDMPFDEVLRIFLAHWEQHKDEWIRVSGEDLSKHPEINEEECSRVISDFLMAHLKAGKNKRTSAESVADLAEYFKVPVSSRAGRGLSVQALEKTLEEKERKLEEKDREIEQLRVEVWKQRATLDDFQYERQNESEYARAEEERRQLADTKAQFEKRKQDEKIANMFTTAVQVNIARQYMKDVNDSKKPGVDLEEIRKRRRNPLRPFEFFE